MRRDLSDVGLGPEEEDRPLSLQARFVDNWAGLARVFGMDARLGRVHAVVYLASEPITCGQVASSLNMDAAECQQLLDELGSWGVVDKTDAGYEAERDPWTWFMVTVRERTKRELLPIVESIREVEELAIAQGPGSRAERIGRFTRFVEQLSVLIETFASLGAGPMGGLLRMATRLIARR